MLVTHEKMSGSTNFTMLFQIKGDAVCIVFNIKTACSQAKKYLRCEIPQDMGFLVFKISQKKLLKHLSKQIRQHF